MTRTSRNVTVGLIVRRLAGRWPLAAGLVVGTAAARRSEPTDPDPRCWSGIRSSSTRSLRRIRRTPPVSGSGRSFTRRSSMPTTASNGATRRSSFTTGAPHGASRRAAVIAAAYTALVGLFPSRQPALDASYAASLAALSDDGGRTAAQSRERGIAWGTEVAQAVLAWRATDGFSASYPAVHRWDRGRPVAADTAGVRTDERPGVGIHRDVRPGQQHPVRAWTTARSDQRHVHGRFQRRQGARSQDRIDAHRRTRRRSRRSGRATPASTGIRPRTRLRAPTTCPCPTATGFSRS